MTRVLVEVDGKAVYEKTFQDSKVSISSHRDVTALYKMGQQEPYTLAPSRLSQDVIICEDYCETLGNEITTMDKKCFVNPHK